ncbi:MAG: alpha/beta fold hydrolase [Burkholderiales bacterium]|nr:alpha/beta fold hydrolase [Burkholderiales bacterium]
MRRRLFRHGLWVTLLAVSVLAGCATLDEKQREWVFQPSKQSWWGGSVASEGMQDVWIDFRSAESGEPVKLHGLWLPQARADAPLLLYLHGARWDVRSSAHRMRRMHELGFAVLGIDYRGFGQSTDTLPSETLAYEDARAAWDWLGAQHPVLPRYVFGHSLGGAIAVALAAQVDDERGVLVEGSFSSVPDVVSSFKWGWLPVGPLITQRFDAESKVDKLGSPLLVVHGSNDRLIPPALGRKLYERAKDPKRFVLVEGGSHHNTNAVGQPLYREAVAELFGLRPPVDGERLAQGETPERN